MTQADLLQGPIRPLLLRMTLPLMLGMVSLMSFNLLDTWFVSRLGTTALAAISFTFPVTFSLISLTIGMGIGTSAVLAHHVGQGQVELARRKGTVALVAATAAMLLGALLGMKLSPSLFQAMGATGETLHLILGYIQIWFSGCVFLTVAMVGNAIFRAFGNTRVPTIIMVTGSLINAVMDPLLIFGVGPFPALGLRGAALASLFSWLGGALLMGWWLLLRHRLLGWPGLGRHLWAYGREILHIALPAALANMLTPLASVILTAMVAGFGREAVAAYGVGGRIESISCLVILALSMALPPFISQNQGGGRLDRVTLAYRGTLRLVLGIQLLIYLLLAACAAWIAAAFSAETEVQHLIRHYLWILPLGYGWQGVIVLTNSSFNALHRPRQGLVLSLVRFGLFVLPLSWLGARSGHLEGLLLGGLVANLLCAGLAYLWFNHSLKGIAGESR